MEAAKKRPPRGSVTNVEQVRKNQNNNNNNDDNKNNSNENKNNSNDEFLLFDRC